MALSSLKNAALVLALFLAAAPLRAQQNTKPPANRASSSGIVHPAPGQAQPGVAISTANPEQEIEKGLQTLDRLLGLSEDQRPQVRGIISESLARKKLLEQQLKDNQTEAQKKIYALLSDAQRSKFDEMTGKKAPTPAQKSGPAK